MKHYEKHYPSEVKGAVLDNYLARGWFRMRSAIFTTTHIINESEHNLNRVWWLRYRLGTMPDQASHRRVKRNFRGYRVQYVGNYFPTYSDNRLFEKYRSSVRFHHYKSIHDCLYTEQISGVFDTHAIRVYSGNRLIALSVFDTGADSVAAILQAYDPAYRVYSPGKYLMLLTMDHMRDQGFTNYYPGYIIAGNTQMDYKLFPGSKAAVYYDNTLGLWRPFHHDILLPERHDEEEVYDFYWWMLGREERR